MSTRRCYQVFDNSSLGRRAESRGSLQMRHFSRSTRAKSSVKEWLHKTQLVSKESLRVLFLGHLNIRHTLYIYTYVYLLICSCSDVHLSNIFVSGATYLDRPWRLFVQDVLDGPSCRCPTVCHEVKSHHWHHHQFRNVSFIVRFCQFAMYSLNVESYVWSTFHLVLWGFYTCIL